MQISRRLALQAKFSRIVFILFFAICISTINIVANASSSSNKNDKWVHINKNGSRSSESSMPFFPHRANIESHDSLEKKDFDDAKLCGSCHSDIYEQWRGSMMAYSWDDPIYRALLKRASEATDGKVDNFCTGCHTPIGLTTGQITSEVNRKPFDIDAEEDSIPGVDCEACHNMSDRTGMDNGAYVMMAGRSDGKRRKFGPRPDAKSQFHESVYSEMHTSSEFCGPCHNVTHPFNNVPIERTYDEWLESPYPSANIGCQDCHMKNTPGRAAVNGPLRSDVASHWFSGANSTILRYFGHDEAAELARQTLQEAAAMEFVTLPKTLQAGQISKVKIKVSNIGAGHKLPTGFPEGREMWVDFSVKDKNGVELYRSGQVKNGKTEEGTRNFKVHLGDKDGKEVDLEVWTVTHIISDNRILPKGYNIAEYEFNIPKEAKAPYTLTATLKYWPFSQALVDLLVGKNKIQVEIVDMTTISKTIPELQLSVAQ